MGFYHYVVGLGTILVLAFVWNGLDYAIGTTVDNLSATIPNTSGNGTVNQTDIRNQYTIVQNYTYYSFFFIVVFILIWIIKVSVEEQKAAKFGF